jgi:hypothetical protein
MTIGIVPYAKDHVPEVKAFNARLKEGGVRFQFPMSPIPEWLPGGEGRRIYQQMFLAVEDDRTVRGGYILKHQPFLVQGEEKVVGNYQLPLSEGTVDKAYNALGLFMVNDALKRRPLLYALGMGGLDQPLPRMLEALGWATRLVPFYFRVLKPARFFRNIRYLRRSLFHQMGMDLLAASGVGHLIIRIWQGKLPRAESGDVTIEPVDQFDPWVNDIWRQSGEFTLGAVRDHEVLDVLYPATDKRFLRLQVSDKSGPLGWFVCLGTQLRNHKQFGNMRVGSIVDCLTLAGSESKCLAAVVRFLAELEIDLIVSNQSHIDYWTGLQEAGLRSGPSNFGLALSPRLADLLQPLDDIAQRFHFNRGDGDGPINL